MRSAMGDPGAAVRLLRDGLEQGMWWAPTLLRDGDLEAANFDRRLSRIVPMGSG
jgi:hypothetical protein